MINAYKISPNDKEGCKLPVGAGVGRNSSECAVWGTGGPKIQASSIYGGKRIVSGKPQDLNMALGGPEARPRGLQQRIP